MTFDRKSLMRRMVEIDYEHKHRHLPGSLSALPIIADIYEQMGPDDIFILSKGHSCAALYCVLEAIGLHPDVSLVHPERDVANGVEITAGSLGHGLPIGVGIAYAKMLQGKPGIVHVLMGDGEMQEGSVYEGLQLAERLDLEETLIVHVDNNRYQGSCFTLTEAHWELANIFPVFPHRAQKGKGVAMFEATPEKSVHLLTEVEFKSIMEELAE